VASPADDQGAGAASLYDHLAVAVNGDPDPPGTIYTAKVETVDNDQLPAQLGGFAPL
jgi:hypothetical protein